MSSRAEVAKIATGIGDCTEKALLLSGGESSAHVNTEIHLFSDNGKVYIGSNGKVIIEKIEYYPLTLAQRKLVSIHNVDFTLEESLTKTDMINVCTYICDYLLGAQDKIHVIEIIDKVTLEDKLIILPTLFRTSKFCVIPNVLVGDTNLGRSLEIPNSLSAIVLDIKGEVI